MTDTLPLVWGFMREIPYCESWRNAGCNLSGSSINALKNYLDESGSVSGEDSCNGGAGL